MIPLRDTIPSLRVPICNYVIIAVNVLVFMYEVSLGDAAEQFVGIHGLVPSEFAFEDLLTSMFLHGSWAHLLGNMLYLYIFGDNVEDRLGHLRYVGFYLLCGMAAGLGQALTNPASHLPMVGASGAIAGVSGAYLLLFPRSRIVTLVPIFFLIQVIEVPAVFFLVVWFALQIVMGMSVLARDQSVGGVAFWAHVGGFVAGMVLGPIMRERRRAAAGWV
jgi:membrane associated rhomboid family serine protease